MQVHGWWRLCILCDCHPYLCRQDIDGALNVNKNNVTRGRIAIYNVCAGQSILNPHSALKKISQRAFVAYRRQYTKEADLFIDLDCNTPQNAYTYRPKYRNIYVGLLT